MDKFAKKFFYNGNIITMTENKFLDREYALLVDDKIIKVDKINNVYPYLDENTQIINLNGKTIMPGFIDAHSHLCAYAMTLSLINLEKCDSVTSLIETLKNHQNDNEWIIGYGYDENKFIDDTKITKIDLDKVSTINGVLISHASGHFGVVNSVGLKILGLTNTTENPHGGKYDRDQNGEINGRLIEQSYFAIASKIVLPPEKMLNNLKKAFEIYASFGITTAQEGFVGPKEWDLIKENLNPILDLVCYLDLNAKVEFLNLANVYNCYSAKQRVRIGGYKMFLDGSPQGKTAWMKEPYEQTTDYYGSSIYTDCEVIEKMNYATKTKKQLLVHANGDRACQQFANCFSKIKPKLERPVLIHAQLIDWKELEDLRKEDVIVSFFPSHIYYYGDLHLKNFGPRAQFISPLSTAKEYNLCFTIHTDAPVMKPNIIETIHHGINRQAMSGEILGSGEKITAYEALKAVTVNASYQYFEENIKGTIEPGKAADLVILSDNPLTIEPCDFKNIVVLETIKNGQTIYQK